MRKTSTFLFILLLVLTGCNLPTSPQNNAAPTDDLVATQVAELLTAQPSATQPVQATQPPVDMPADTPTATATLEQPTSTIEAGPSPTTNPGDPAASLGEPTWQDSLDTAKNFYLYENDNTKVESEDSALALTGRNANGWLGWSLTYAQQSTDFYLEGTFNTRDCSGTDLYGLVFRANKESAGYFYGVTCGGQYNLFARDFNNNTDTELIALKTGSGINTGSNQVNRLGVLAQGSKISLYVNGALVDEINDSTYSTGYFGALVAANQTAGFRVDLDQVKLWKF
jgi:hypothetical protein